jgi:hypothetical protein
MPKGVAIARGFTRDFRRHLMDIGVMRRGFSLKSVTQFMKVRATLADTPHGPRRRITSMEREDD